MNILLLLAWAAFYIQAATIPVSPFTKVLDDGLLLWGPYRPNLYLGLRPRMQESLLMGLMWYRSEDVSHIAKNLRHTCEQNEGMAGYGWSTYDVRSGGTQIINDTGNGVDLVTHFNKISTSADDQIWGLRIRGMGRAGTKADQKVTVVFYVGNEDPRLSLGCTNKPKTGSDTHLASHAICEGDNHSEFNFRLDVVGDRQGATTNGVALNVSVYSIDVDTDAIWKAKDVFLEQVKAKAEHTDMLPEMVGPGNLQYIQMTFSGDLEFDILFHSSSRPKPDAAVLLDADVERNRASFEKQFLQVYEPQQPFEEEEYRTFSKSLLSNLMGGIGFFYGTSKVSSVIDAEKASLDSADISVTEQGPYKLFSAVPSRPFFPRGFLWDEGFHLQVILDWDMDLAVEIVTSWLNLMDDNGWIAREQILGPEARSKVPPEFQTQYQHYANPPTMFRVVDMFVDRLTGDIPYSGAASQHMTPSTKGSSSQLSEKTRAFLEAVYQKLQKHYEWFIRTQAGQLDKYGLAPNGDPFNQGYRWRGRTTQHILSSGLDDYPRASTPSQDELHLDALCWVGFMTKILHKISIVLSPNEFNTSQYSDNITSILHTLDNIHWSETEQAYCDTTIEDSNPTRIVHICHKGYISLLPFLTGLLPPIHPHLPTILYLIESPNHLWSPHGLRSLSLSSPLYGTAENYWRGPIWINFNYMALEQLLTLSQHPGPLAAQAARLYTLLRKNIVNTVFQSWKETGFAWEQYNPETGKGQRTQYFTGWTALVVRIMAMPELDVVIDDTSIEEDSVIQTPHDTRSWGGMNLLFLVTVMLVVCFVFRRRLFRVWRSWLEDR